MTTPMSFPWDGTNNPKGKQKNKITPTRKKAAVPKSRKLVPKGPSLHDQLMAAAQSRSAKKKRS